MSLLRAEQAAKKATKGNNIKFAVKNFRLSESDIQNNISSIGQMENVAILTGNEFAKSNIGLPEQVDNFFAEYNYSILNPDIGDVEINRRGAKDSIAHGIGRNKAVAFAAVPHTIEKGKIIDYQPNWKNRQYDTIVLAAPISINGEKYYQGVIVIRDKSSQRFYLHEVITEKEGGTSFKTGAGTKYTPGDVSPSLVSLLEKIRNVNNNESYSINNTAAMAELTAKYGESKNGVPVSTDGKTKVMRGIASVYGTSAVQNDPELREQLFSYAKS